MYAVLSQPSVALDTQVASEAGYVEAGGVERRVPPTPIREAGAPQAAPGELADRMLEYLSAARGGRGERGARRADCGLVQGVALSSRAGTSGRSRAMKWPASGTSVKVAAGSRRRLACRSEGRDQSFCP